MEWRMHVLRSTLFKVESFLPAGDSGKFFTWLDKFDDYAGKGLINTVDSIMNANKSHSPVLKKVVYLLDKRLVTFCDENKIQMDNRLLIDMIKGIA